MKAGLIGALVLVAGCASAVDFVNRPPVQGGGVSRSSQLWIDPTGNNDLDGDAICYTDFVFGVQSTIEHLEWWGDIQMNLGFEIEFWRQDPNTIAYQPLGVFRGQGAQPEASFRTTNYTTSTDPTGTLHFSLDLDNPITLAANDSGNVRWFLAIIGRTDVPYQQFKWSQDSTFTGRTFQWIRGGNEGGGDVYRSLGDGRAFRMSGTPVPEPATVLVLASGAAFLLRRRRRP